MMRCLPVVALLFVVAPVRAAGITVDGTVHPSLQAAVDALPDSGGEIRLAPGVYREKVSITRRGVRLRGIGRNARQVTISWGDSHETVGGTLKSATLTASGDDFR